MIRCTVILILCCSYVVSTLAQWQQLSNGFASNEPTENPKHVAYAAKPLPAKGSKPSDNDPMQPALTTVVSPVPEEASWICGAGWTYRNGSRKCYKVFSRSTTTWKKSLDHCSSFGGLLAVIDSHDTQAFLVDLLDQMPHSNLTNTADGGGVFAWIGLTRMNASMEEAPVKPAYYQWIMDMKTQDNYKIGFYKSNASGESSNQHGPSDMFTPYNTTAIKWAKSEPSFHLDNCGALAVYSKTAKNYFYFREFDGKVFDLPCENQVQAGSQPPYSRVEVAICEMRASKTGGGGAPARPHSSVLLENHEIYGDLIVPVPDLLWSNELAQDSVIIRDTLSNLNTANNWMVPKWYWQNGIVPYEFADGFTTTERNLLQMQMRDITADVDSCVTFRQRTSGSTEVDYVKFLKTHDASCAARGIGRRGGEQHIVIGPICLAPDGLSHIKHEILHVLGMPHEHQRYDRDNHIDVLEDNIIALARSQFMKIKQVLPVWVGFEYDFGSIMHYPDNAFSFSPSNLKTLVAKQTAMTPFLQITDRKLSRLDREKLKWLYCQRGRKIQSGAEQQHTQKHENFKKQKPISRPVITNSVASHVPLPTSVSLSTSNNNKTLVCVLQFWSFSKTDLPVRMSAADTPPDLCTHIVYFSARIQAGEVVFATAAGWNGEDAGTHYPKVLLLRKLNPKLKVLIAVQLRASVSIDNSLHRAPTSGNSLLVAKIIKFVRHNNADGIVLTEARDKGEQNPRSLHSDNFQAALLHDMRAAVNTDAHQNAKTPLILGTAISESTFLASAEANVKLDQVIVGNVNKYADFVWLRPNRDDPQLQDGGAQLQLLPGSDSNSLTAVDAAIARGILPQKVILSIETSWKSYTLHNETKWQPDGVTGIVRRDAQPYEWKLSANEDGSNGRVSFTELCLDMSRHIWVRKATQVDDAAAEPYAARGNLWVKYDNAFSVANKVAYAQKIGLAGVAITSLAYDDPHGYCLGERFPLTVAAHRALQMDAVNVNVRGAVVHRCLTFPTSSNGTSHNNANSTSAACLTRLTCGHFPSSSFSTQEANCVGLSTTAGFRCVPPSKTECFLNEAARSALENHNDGSLDGAIVSTAGSATVTLNCNGHTLFKTNGTRYYFYCSKNFMNESSVDIYACNAGSEFMLKRFACLAD